MTKAEFLEQLAEMLQLDEQPRCDDQLAEMPEWDSLAFMVLITFFNRNFGQRVTFDDLKVCGTPADLIKLAKGGIH